MKKLTGTILLILLVSSVFADGHNLDGMVWYFMGYVLLLFVAPLLVLTILSVRYYYRQRKVILGLSLALLIFISIVGTYFFAKNVEYASYQRAGVAYKLGLLFFIVVVATNLLLLYFGFRKTNLIINTKENN